MPWGQDRGFRGHTEPEEVLVCIQTLSNTAAEDPSDPPCSPQGAESFPQCKSLNGGEMLL